MYEKHFQLRERPFALSPDPEYLYPSKVHQEALGYLRYGIEGHAGFVMITGEIGSGKTTMLQSLLRHVDRNTTVARIVNTMLEPRELLEAILLDFGMDPSGLSKPVILHRLAEFLVRQRQAGRRTLLVIDEAQNLSFGALEEIRMLSNVETEKSKLIQIIMVGQPELREKLRLPQLEQLRQRITVSYHLQPLDSEETSHYINHRLRRAAAGPPVEFPEDVTQLIHRHSRGVPRTINVISDATLLFAFGLDRQDIDLQITQEALAELDETGVLASYQTEGEEALRAASVTVAEAQEAMQQTDAVRQRERVVSDRERELRDYERELRDREQALSAQQRVIEEQARLLATRPAGNTPPAASNSAAVRASGGGAPRPGVPAAPSSGARQVPPPRQPQGQSPGQVRQANQPGGSTQKTRTQPAAPSAPARPGDNVRRDGPPPAIRPAARTGGNAQGSTTRILVPTAVPVAPQQPIPIRHMSVWGRLRRALFGTESETGA